MLNDPFFIYGRVYQDGILIPSAYINIYDVDSYQGKAIDVTISGQYQVNIQNIASNGHKIMVETSMNNKSGYSSFYLDTDDLFKEINLNLKDYKSTDSTDINIGV